jgi:hypothetical protein
LLKGCVKPPCEDCAPCVDPDNRQITIGMLFGNLMGNPNQGPLH